MSSLAEWNETYFKNEIVFVVYDFQETLITYMTRQNFKNSDNAKTIEVIR